MNETIDQPEAGSAPDTPTGTADTSHRAERRVLAGVFLLLASLGIMVSAVTLWAHQAVLTTDGWTDASGEIVTDPEVIDAAGVVVVDQASEALDLRGTVVDIMPAGELYGGLPTTRLEEVLADIVSDGIASEGFLRPSPRSTASPTNRAWRWCAGVTRSSPAREACSN